MSSSVFGLHIVLIVLLLFESKTGIKGKKTSVLNSTLNIIADYYSVDTLLKSFLKRTWPLRGVFNGTDSNVHSKKNTYYWKNYSR